MKLTIVGCHSASPRYDANPTAQILEVKGHVFLIDCGEGTQVQLRKFKIKFARIKHIFISHLHGDHFFGLVGLISTFKLLGRDASLHVYGPKGIKQAILLQLKLGKTYTNFELYFHELESNQPELLFEDAVLSITTIPLKHRVYTNGFLFQQKPGERILNIQKAKELDIDPSYYQKAKQGFDVPDSKGDIVSNAAITFDPAPPKSYAYCSDTAYCEEIIPQISNTTLLYHEATFLQQHAALALKTMHSTARQAALIAKKATVGTLLLGHYSGRYNDNSEFKNQAQEVFLATQLAQDGKVFEI
jgi:ribonuclease Z